MEKFIMDNKKQKKTDEIRAIESLLKARFKKNPSKNCSDFDLWIYEYAIKELDLEKTKKVEKHLQECSQCFTDYLDLMQYLNERATNQDKNILKKTNRLLNMTAVVDFVGMGFILPSQAKFDMEPLLEAASNFKLPIFEVISPDERLIVETTVKQIPERLEVVVDFVASFYGTKTEKVLITYYLMDRSKAFEKLLKKGEIAMVWTEKGGIGRWFTKAKQQLRFSSNITKPVLIVRPQFHSMHKIKNG